MVIVSTALSQGVVGMGEQNDQGSFQDAQTVEEYVRDYFTDTPIMTKVAECETHFRHFDRWGNVIRGEINRSDIGVMQVNEYYHGKTAEKLGHDIYTLDGNLAYARYLYEREGTRPWNSSSRCWKDNHIAQK